MSKFGPLRAVFFFLPEKKKIEPEKIFNIRPEKFSNWPKKNLENCPGKKNVHEKKQQNSTREKKNPSREKKGKLYPRQLKKYPRKNSFQNINIELFSQSISETVAGLCYGDFFSNCLKLS